MLSLSETHTDRVLMTYQHMPSNTAQYGSDSLHLRLE